uniref:T cell receptor gamma constant 2 n=1 Tax=Equus caballus TaxID=9796 RepID=A0A3Q2HSP6_HORSE
MLRAVTLLLAFLAPDRRLPANISPKPTIFLPSIAEINLHRTGTYICLLENFFPDVIKVYWKQKNCNTILESQEGKTMKTNDTYMKLSWLTVTEKSLNKEHKCIVQHENNKGGVDQEILFPSENDDILQLQLTYTSGCYTYFFLLLTSAGHLAIIASCLLRRTAVCGNARSS